MLNSFTRIVRTRQSTFSSLRPAFSSPITQFVRDYTVYFGNLSFDASEHDLKTLVDRFDVNVSVRIPRDNLGRTRGFGFADFSQEDQANQVIGELNGTNFMGRELKVSRALERSNTPRDGEYF
ncbi:5149_t:CDS:1 [Paraglomus occultum]|uniref:5149_t:CDS:1 n=1 Tax=Paraglomus occultum TaxID=144539 RepID=A0A9N8VPK3_9GLOM|nr:5149_t:CDS:1 [Paraglomus occultum]